MTYLAFHAHHPSVFNRKHTQCWRKWILSWINVFSSLLKTDKHLAGTPFQDNSMPEHQKIKPTVTITFQESPRALVVFP
jgi:hypothetical protein